MQLAFNSLGRHDRIRFGGASFRPASQEMVNGQRLLQLVTDGVPQDHYRLLGDDELAQRLKEKSIRIDREHFSRAGQLSIARGDDSDLGDLDEEQSRTVAWKVEWCRRFNRAYALGQDDGSRTGRTPKHLNAFIERNKETIHRWYIEEFGVPRPPGREPKPGELRKLFDYPSGTTLRDWLDRYAALGERRKAFRTRYANCGNKKQFDPRAERIVKTTVKTYASRTRPTIADIHLKVELAIAEFNHSLADGATPIRVSERAVRRRIRKLAPLYLVLGREGADRARKTFDPNGEGLGELDRMERVEMDDWEMDLHAVLKHKHVRALVSDKARAKAKRLKKAKVTIRCTITAAIDCATKCLVGLAVRPLPPSTAGSKSALRTIIADKSPLADFAGAQSDWRMHARPRTIATDGGPAFRGECERAMLDLGIEHLTPEGDPRSRGTIESFFRTFKRFCRMFTGQSFSNVVERGDYPAEELASLLVEDLEKHLTRFIVDDYHHRPHRGLGGKRPWAAWHEWDPERSDLDVYTDDVQCMIAFGSRLKDRRISPDGIRYLDVDYTHPAQGVIHGLVGRRPLHVIVDPNDMGRMLVRTTQELRDAFPGDGDYLVFVAKGYEGIRLLDHEIVRRHLRAVEREEEAKGKPFRLGALRDLTFASDQARLAAGVPSHELDDDALARAIAGLERRSAIAFDPPPGPRGKPMSLDDGASALGIHVAGAQAPPPPAPRASDPLDPFPGLRNGSINTLDDEDET